MNHAKGPKVPPKVPGTLFRYAKVPGTLFRYCDPALLLLFGHVPIELVEVDTEFSILDPPARGSSDCLRHSSRRLLEFPREILHLEAVSFNAQDHQQFPPPHQFFGAAARAQVTDFQAEPSGAASDELPCL